MAIATGLVVAGIAGVAGAALQGSAAEDAANTQANASAHASDIENAQFEESRADLAPFRQTGVLANQTLAMLLGLTPNATPAASVANPGAAPPQFLPAPGFGAGGLGDQTGGPQTGVQLVPGGGSGPGIPNPAYATWQTANTAFQAAQNAPAGPADPRSGSLLAPFTGASVATDPGYQFGLDQGTLAVDRGASAGGMRLSPATLKALDRFTQDYAGTKFNDAFSRDMSTKQFTYNALSGLSDQGRGASSTTAALGAQTAAQIGSNTIGAGNAQAAGTIGASNAYAGALNNTGSQFVNYAMLDKFLKGGGYGNTGFSGNSQYLP